MIKSKEVSDPNSCLNRAADDEPIFVLRAHDVTMPAAIDAWIDYRIKAGKNMPNDPQIVEATRLAHQAEEWRLREAAANA